MSVTFGPGITISSGVSVTPSLAGFTINSSDITTGFPVYQNTTALGTNGVDGFENTAAENWLGEGYQINGLTPSLVSAVSSYVSQYGINPNNTSGYVYNVTWGAGSSIISGLVKIGFNANSSYMLIQAIDPADTNWQQDGNNSGTSLVGTFLFPATFTIYQPLTNKSGWC